MADLLALSSRFIDQGTWEGVSSVQRMTTELSEVADGVGLIEAFSNVVVLRTEAGSVLFDTSLRGFAQAALSSLRKYDSGPIHSIIYTHGHVDHVGGTPEFLADAERRGHARPALVGHENVQPRFDRYDRTLGYNTVINKRQFGNAGMGSSEHFRSDNLIGVDTAFRDTLQLEVGNLSLDLRHDRGETDDHLWAYVPERDAIVVGDFLTWVFPNAGNPQKVQRYPDAWASALRKMIACKPSLLLPAHGLPIGGQARIARVLDDVACALESLLTQTLELMNDGATLNTILHTVRVPERLRDCPYLQPVYDEPEFVVRNIWRLYGGWYDGDPSQLKPAASGALAQELSTLAGGPITLAKRGADLVDAGGDVRVACHLVEMAALAAPEDPEVHALRAHVYKTRRDGETSLMARGIFGTAAAASADKAPAADTPPDTPKPQK